MDEELNLELLSSEEESNHSSSSDEEEEQEDEIETSDLESNDGEMGTGSAKLPTVTAETSEAAATALTEERNNNKARSKVQTVDGVDLFPPSGSKGPRASKAWAYGGLKKDEKGKLLTDKMYCSLCPKIFKYTFSPSALMDHLNSKHMEAMIELDAAKKQSQAKLTDFKFMKTSNQEKYKASNPKQKQFRSDLQDWIVKAKRPFSIFNDLDLKKVIKNLDPRINVPHGKTITRDIATNFMKKKKLQKEKLKGVDFFSCTNDGGSSLSNSTFIGINAHWIDEEFKSQKKLIDMRPVEGKTATEYWAAVDNSLDSHGIKAKTFSFTTDNEPTMLKSFVPSERTGCFAHIESKVKLKSLSPVTFASSDI